MCVVLQFSFFIFFGYVDHRDLHLLPLSSPTRRSADLEAAARGFTLVDAPVSGGPQGATAVTIAIMVGAPAPVFEQIKEALLAISPNVVHCGDVGAGQIGRAHV